MNSQTHIDELRQADRDKLGFKFRTGFQQDVDNIFRCTTPTSNFVLITNRVEVMEAYEKMTKKKRQ